MTPTAFRWISLSVTSGAFFLLVASATEAVGQRALPVAAGARIKLVAPESGVPWSATAIVDSVDGDTLYVHSLSEPPALRSASHVAIPLGAIRRLQISRGRASRIGRAGRGALWGLAVDAILTGAYIAHEKATCRADCFDDGFQWMGFAIGVPWSAGIGATIGAALPVERWQRVTLDRR